MIGNGIAGLYQVLILLLPWQCVSSTHPNCIIPLDCLAQGWQVHFATRMYDSAHDEPEMENKYINEVWLGRIETLERTFIDSFLFELKSGQMSATLSSSFSFLQ